MTNYTKQAKKEMRAWQRRMQRSPSLVNNLTSKVQTRINRIIPEKVHVAITTAIKQMTRAVLFGAEFLSAGVQQVTDLELTEQKIAQKVNWYKKTAAAGGGVTGAGGILLAFADFPILLGIKMKMLYDIAAMYGRDVKDYKERVFLLYIFQLAFSSQQHRNDVFVQMMNWEQKAKALPEDINEFDWRNFQQQYRDYIDLAKLAQMLPIIGAAVGIIVNYRLINKLEVTAKNAFRMRMAEEGRL